MKKWTFVLFLCICMHMVGLPVEVLAAEVETKVSGEFEFGDWDCYLDSDGNVSILSYLGESRDVVIPDKINGNWVTAIESSCFEGCSNLTSIAFPLKLERIEYNAFKGTGLTSVTIPKTLTKYNKAFAGAEYLTEVIFEDGTEKIPEGALREIPALTKVKIPESVLVIEDKAFYACKNLTNITLPSKLQHLGVAVFSGTGITSITIPKTVEECGSAFSGSENVREEFTGADHLTEVIFEEGTPWILHGALKGASAVTKVKIPESVSAIFYGAFQDCTSLTSITLPDGVYDIDDYAFSGCSNLKTVTLSKELREIGDYAFYGCSSLTSITFPQNLQSIGEFAFCKTGLSKVVIPKSVTEIGEYAFHECTGLKMYGYADSAAEAYAKEDMLVQFHEIDDSDLNTENENTGNQTGENVGDVTNDAWLETVEQADMRMVDGKWLYYENGVFNAQKYGFVGFKGSVFLVANGVLASEVYGLAVDPNSSDWYFLAGGQVQTQHTGLAQYDGEWFYVNAGRLDTTMAGYVDYDGSKFYVAAGQIKKNVSGLAQDPKTAKWYYLAEGQAQLQYTGLAQYDGVWFYVVDGALAEDYTGYVDYDGSRFYVVNGKLA